MSTTTDESKPQIGIATADTSSRAVNELVAAADNVRSHAEILFEAMSICKDTSRAISQVAQAIATGVAGSSRAAHSSDDLGVVSPAVVAALTATREVLVECSAALRSAAARNAVARVVTKAKTVETLNGYLLAMGGLRDFLKIEGDRCGIMQNPVSGLNIDASGCTKSVILDNISAVDAIYDGLKITLGTMANMTDGLPWPIKAVPQTVLFVLKLFEDCKVAPAMITQLLSEVQNLWRAVADLGNQPNMPGSLSTHVAQFFETLLRIAIRLKIASTLGVIKRSLSVYTFSAVIEDETQRIADARRQLGLALQTATITQVGMLNERVNRVLQVAPLVSDISSSMTLPPAPRVFHGREAFVNATVEKLVCAEASHIAIVGTGGIGKTSIALVVIHDKRIETNFQEQRIFLSCEALVDADSVVVALGTRLGLEASKDLLTKVVSTIRTCGRLLLLLDNLETIWLVEDTARASGVERLLRTFAEIDSLSLIITCRGVVLPPGIEWSNSRDAAIGPFSLQAARRTFLDTSRIQLDDRESNALDELLQAVDAMPLAVSILGQLADSEWGSSPSELAQRWNSQHSALLQTRKSGREHNVDASISLSINLLQSATDSPEPLRLLSTCSMLPDGLRPAVADELRPHFEDIYGARQLLRKFALINIDLDGTMTMLGPIRRFVMARFPVDLKQYDAVCSIYLGIAQKLPIRMDQQFMERAAVVAPEMANLSSLLLLLVERPTHDVVHAVARLTNFSYWRQPTIMLVAALLPHLNGHANWKALCLRVMGQSQQVLCDYRDAIRSFRTAAAIYTELGDINGAAWCKSNMASVHRVLGEYNEAEIMLNEALNGYTGIGAEIEEARCMTVLAKLMRLKGDHTTALRHITVATAIFTRHEEHFAAAQCTETLGLVYLDQQNFESASRAFEVARSVFVSLGDQYHRAQNTRFLGTTSLLQDKFEDAEKLLAEAEALHSEVGDKLGMAECALEFGYLRRAEQRSSDAILNFKRARNLYESIGLLENIKLCDDELGLCT